MIELIIGLIWNLVLIPFYFIVFSAPDKIDMPVLLILGLFSVVGIVPIVIGIRKIVKKNKIRKEGTDYYGKIVTIRPNGTYVNGRAQLEALFVCCIKGTPRIFEATIGFKYGGYHPGAYVKTRCLDDDAILIGLAEESKISSDDLEEINQTAEQFGKSF